MTTRRLLASRGAKSNETATTGERIIHAAIELFNQRGIQHVAIELIASSIQMSPGNLTYHFKRKRDLVHATFALLEARLSEVLEPAIPAASPREGAEYLVNILRSFWEFRFFFNALTFLLSQDPKLREKYLRFQELALQSIDAGFQEMVRKGQLRPIRHPNTTRLLADNVWSQWLTWLRAQQLSSPEARTPEGQALYDSALHHWSLLEPYFNEEFADALLPLYRTMLLDGVSATAPDAEAKTGKGAWRP